MLATEADVDVSSSPAAGAASRICFRSATSASSARCRLPRAGRPAVGHEQDTPLCDLAADARASTPTAAARLFVPDEGELRERLETLRLRSTATPAVSSFARVSSSTPTPLARPGPRTPPRTQAGNARSRRRPTTSAFPGATLGQRLRDRAKQRLRRSLRVDARERAARRRSCCQGPVLGPGSTRSSPETPRISLDALVRGGEAGAGADRRAARERAGRASRTHVALWERGEELYRVCVAKLDAAQGRVEELGRSGPRGAALGHAGLASLPVWRRELLRSTRRRAARFGG